MSAPAIGLRPRTLPPATATLDPSHPLAAGMLAAMAPAHAADLVGRRRLTVASAGTSTRPTPWGMGGQPTADGVPAYRLDVGPYPERMTVLLVAHKLGANKHGLIVINETSQYNTAEDSGTGGFSLGYCTGANSVGWTTANGGGNALFSQRHGSGFQGWNLGGFTIPDGPVTIGATRDTGGTALRGYINGVASSGTNPLGATPTGRLTAMIGTPASGGYASGADRCPVAMLLIWDRVLSARELLDLHADPFQMFRY